MKNILLALATLIPSITPTFARNGNVRDEISNVYNKPLKNHFTINFDPDPVAPATWDDPNHDGLIPGSKDVILLKWSDMAPTLKDFIKLFPNVTINYKYKFDVYARPGEVHKYSYSNENKLGELTENIFKNTVWGPTEIIMQSYYDEGRNLEMLGDSSISTIIDSNGIFHITLKVFSAIEGTCTSNCYIVETLLSISSIQFWS